MSKEHYIKKENGKMYCTSCNKELMSVLPISKTHHACGECFAMLSIGKSVEMDKKRSDEE